MYFLLKLLFLLLLISGIFMYFYKSNTFLIIFHSSLGFFAIVFFMLYCIEHISKNSYSFGIGKYKKKAKKKMAFSGIFHLIIITLSLLSGIILFIYSLDDFYPWNKIHLITSFLIFFSVFLHWIIRKF